MPHFETSDGAARSMRLLIALEGDERPEEMCVTLQNGNFRCEIPSLGVTFFVRPEALGDLVKASR